MSQIQKLEMDNSKQNINIVSDNLLSFLRDEIGNTKVDYEVPPSKIHGGLETSTFKFQLKNIHSSLAGLLALRVFDKLDRPKHQAIMERTIHNALVDQGLPVPYVHFACSDVKYFGYPFLIREYVSGKILPFVFGDDTNIVLGKTHAKLHNVDPIRLKNDLIKEGFGNRQFSFKGTIDRLLKTSKLFPWLGEIVNWLIENRPSECKHPSICHRDFHAGNLLAKNGKVSAILDWSFCGIGDPAEDIAVTLVLNKAGGTKYEVPLFDPLIANRMYLEAYKRERELNEKYLGYYQVLFCVLAFYSGVNGLLFWTKPQVQNDLIHIIYDFSEIRVLIPK